MSLRRLLTACKVFAAAGPTPSIEAITKALAGADVLRELPQLALHRTDETTGRRSPIVGSFDELLGQIKNVTTLTLLHTEHVDVTLFALPPGHSLPVHDHPNLTVHHRVLLGKIHQLSFNWADGDPAVNAPSQPRDAVVVMNEWRTAQQDQDQVSIITPEGGGVVHCFSAGPEGTAVFIDIISPPYGEDPEHAKCSFFDFDGVAAEGANASHYTEGKPARLSTGSKITLQPCTTDASPPMDWMQPVRTSP
jgi:hypothetical protein